MTEWNWIQWPFFLIAVTGSFFVASGRKRIRFWGFNLFLVSNVIMIAWCMFRGTAFGIVATSFAFMATSVRGIYTHRKKTDRRQT